MTVLCTIDAPTPQFGEPVGPWFSKFAWLPVRTYDRRFVWLRHVACRCIQKHSYLDGGADFWFQYSLYHIEPAGEHAA